MDDEGNAGMDGALAAAVIVCLANLAKSEQTEIQVTWFSPV